MLPFGLSAASQLFSNVLEVVVAHLCKQGVMIFPCLDDYLLKAPSQEDTLEATQKTMALFLQLGLQINMQKKIMLISVQKLEFTGARLDALETKASLPLHRFVTLINLVTTAQTSPQTSARTCLQL